MFDKPRHWAASHNMALNIRRNTVLKNHPLARWFEQLTIVRNIAAHHSRLWNRSFTPVSTAGLRTLQRLRSLPQGQSEQLFGALAVMTVLIDHAAPGSSWPRRIAKLVTEEFETIPGRQVGEMGFPTSWRSVFTPSLKNYAQLV